MLVLILEGVEDGFFESSFRINGLQIRGSEGLHLRNNQSLNARFFILGDANQVDACIQIRQIKCVFLGIGLENGFTHYIV